GFESLSLRHNRISELTVRDSFQRARVHNALGTKWHSHSIDDIDLNAKVTNGEDIRSGEFEEGRRGWKKCACLIHVSGTLGGKFTRKQTGKSDWPKAKALVASWETADAWDSKVNTAPTPPAPASIPDRITIADST